ncbi:MAG: hypothetical protein ACSHW1_15045 [Yoonia sp.]|uniref:hypothetical protein n=1 Tax=Yoonia sp. TaxID=2212373 RepID=UPI003EF9154E
MKPIYYGFDGLEFAIKVNIPDTLNETLLWLKNNASECDMEFGTFFGDIHLSVRPTGVRGGYNYSCREESTGDWFFKKPNARDPWGIRFSAMSSALAVLGLEGLRLRCAEVLHALGIHAKVEDYSPSRIDFAVDFLAPDFCVDPKNVVLPARTNIKTMGQDGDFQFNGRSGRNTSVTAGKMPGRQVIIYDKREEVIEKRKHEWAAIWGRAINGHDAPPLDLSDRSTSLVWRVELRAGKRHLKEDWQVNSWASLYDKLPVIFDEMLTDMSYRRPCPDTNRSRWQTHEIWQAVREVVKIDLFTDVPTLSAKEYVEIKKFQKLDEIATQILGLSVSYAVIEGYSAKRFLPALSRLVGLLERMAKYSKRPLDERFKQAEAKYQHLID